MSPITSTAALVGISLVPAVLLYLLFGSNSAAVSWKAVTLGGPVAAFFATFMITSRFYKQLRAVEPTARRRHTVDVAGRWEITSTSNKSDRTASSETDFSVSTDDVLQLTGGTFRREDKSRVIGDWDCHEAVFDGTRLLYRYSLRDNEGRNPVSTGVVSARLTTEHDRLKFLGSWHSFGQDASEGTITLERVN